MNDKLLQSKSQPCKLNAVYLVDLHGAPTASQFGRRQRATCGARHSRARSRKIFTFDLANVFAGPIIRASFDSLTIRGSDMACNRIRVLFSPSGRAPRLHWWASRLLLLPLLPGPYEDLLSELGLPFLFCVLVFAYVAIVIEIKRWHDINYSGWWVLIHFVPIIGSLIAIFLCGFRAGDAGINLYGPFATPEVTPVISD